LDNPRSGKLDSQIKPECAGIVNAKSDSVLTPPQAERQGVNLVAKVERQAFNGPTRAIVCELLDAPILHHEDEVVPFSHGDSEETILVQDETVEHLIDAIMIGVVLRAEDKV
jgi:hypothetical protein